MILLWSMVMDATTLKYNRKAQRTMNYVVFLLESCPPSTNKKQYEKAEHLMAKEETSEAVFSLWNIDHLDIDKVANLIFVIILEMYNCSFGFPSTNIYFLY